MTDDQTLRAHMLKLLDGGQAFMTFDEAVADFPEDAMNRLPPNVPYTPWHLLEHMRLTQWDILDYIRNPNYRYLHWPDDYWPQRTARTDSDAWKRTLQSFHEDLEAIKAIVRDPQTDLMAQIPHGEAGHTILREALLVADHNAYHTGEFAILRQVMGTWQAGRS